MKCDVCGKELFDGEENANHFAEIRRGYFVENEGVESGIECENIKCQIIICHDCYLNDLDLCRFMNKIGKNIR